MSNEEVGDRKSESGGRVPLLRDPDVEMPDDGFTVVAVTDDDDESVTLAYHDGGAWMCATDDSVMDGSVIGWCWQDEAAEILKSAKREVRHG